MEPNRPDGAPDDERRMGPIGWRVPLGTALAAAALAYLVVAQVYGSIPPLPWTAMPTLLLLAAGEVIAAVHTRRRIRRAPGTVPMEPLSAARLVALARASILVGALAAGIFAGSALYLGQRLTAPLPQQDFWMSAGTLAAALVLTGAGYLLEWACRVPDDGESAPPGGPGAA